MAEKAVKKELTPKQARFVSEYLKDLNATQAAIRAGYSAKTAYSISIENLKKPEIAQAIQKHMDARAKKVDLSAEYVLESIKRITVKAEEAGEHTAALKGCELMGKHLKLFIDRQEISAPEGFNIEVKFIDR